MVRGWTHWARRRSQPFGPGNVTVDLWPDLSEFDEDEKFPTQFRHADGSVANVFSSAKRKTVMRHFQWMQQYGIDGAMVQRFTNRIHHADDQAQKNRVLRHCQAAAEKYGRAFAVMYDLSGMKRGSIDRVINDWDELHRKWRITRSRSYLHHERRPLVAVWGIGFKERHDQQGSYSLAECEKLVDALKASNCSVMVGIPTFWREQTRDSVDDQTFHRILEKCDVISPWTVGRYRNEQQVRRHATEVMEPDLAWARQHRIDYLPVVFPGFSWHNLSEGRDPLGQIPRDGGQFLWSQFVAAKRSGASMVYVAMFDEVDEATAIFKCTNSPPVGENVQFLTYDGLPSDHYLRITGKAGQLFRDEIPATDTLPLKTEGPNAAE